MDINAATQVVHDDLESTPDTTEFMYSRDEDGQTIATEYNSEGDVVGHYIVTITLTPTTVV